MPLVKREIGQALTLFKENAFFFYVMKLVIIFLTIASLHVSASAFSQNVTFDGNSIPLDKLFDVITKQTGHGIFVTGEIMAKSNPVSVHFKNASFEEAIKTCLRQQHHKLDYYWAGNGIIIQEIKEPSNSVINPSDTGGSSQNIVARGTIFNQNGQPISGANITDRKSGRGTISNAKGEYELTKVGRLTTLTISYVGYASQQIKVIDDTKVQIYLQLAQNELDKVVVQAYGTTTERLNTGNIQTVTAAQIERQPIMNPLEALQGQVPGLVITQTSGYASAPFKVEIRGRSGIDPNVPSDPLYIIDGVPLTTLNNSNGGTYATGSYGVAQNGFAGPAGGQSPFFSLNPADIESVTVLKDADATAIYGSRGANGVILINTKSGKPGKTKLSVNAYSGESAITRHYSLLNTTQYLAMRREAFKNDGIVPDASNAYDLLVWDTSRNTDWQKYFLGGIGKVTDLQTSFDGGDKLTNFRVAGSFHRQTSILSYSGADQRGAVQFNLSHKSMDQRLNLSFTGIYSFSQSNLINFPASLLLAPDAPPILDADGGLNFAGWAPSRNVANWGTIFDPYTAKTDFLNSTVKIDYEVLKGLKISGRLGYSRTHQSQIQISPITSQDPLNNPTGQSEFGNNNNTSTIIEPNIEYNRLVGNGKLNVLFGGSAQSTTQDGNNVFGIGYVNDNLLGSISNAPTVTSTDIGLQYKYAAVFGRINYNWADKYILNLSARRDGSSRFGAGNQFGNFGALGAAWIFTQEKWFTNNLTFLSFGKVRSSYGLTGSDNIFDYEYLSRWSIGNHIPYRSGVPIYIPSQLENPYLHWETNRKLEFALDLGFMKDRITLEVVYYRNRSGDQLLSYPEPSVTGFGSVVKNLPATVENSGIEGTLRAKLIEKKDIEWAINLNIGANYNKLVAYSNLDQSPYADLYYVGKPLNLVPLLHYTGVDPLTGQYTFLDKNKNGVVDLYGNVNSNDRFLHDLNIRPDGSFSTDFRYKNFQLNAYFTFRRQLIPSASFGTPGAIAQNQSTQVLNRWQKPGDNAQFAKYTTQNSTGYSYYFTESDAYFSDGSYIRLRNLSISYSLISSWAKKAGLSGSLLYIRGENLFVITKYNGIDPDVPGVGALPPAKSLTVGIQFHF